MVQEWLCVLYRDKARMAPMLPTMVAALHVLHTLPEMEALQVLSRCEETRGTDEFPNALLKFFQAKLTSDEVEAACKRLMSTARDGLAALSRDGDETDRSEADRPETGPEADIPSAETPSENTEDSLMRPGQRDAIRFRQSQRRLVGEVVHVLGELFKELPRYFNKLNPTEVEEQVTLPTHGNPELEVASNNGQRTDPELELP